MAKRKPVRRRRREAFRTIVTKKAEFLVNTEIQIAHLLEVEKKLREEASRMPDRGILQRRARFEKLSEADGIYERLCLRLGESALRTFHFVKEHRKKIPKKIRLALIGKEKRGN